MLRKHTTILPLLLLLGLLLSVSAQAEPAVARVLFAHGEVQAQRDGVSTRALNRGDTLHAGDTIQTGRASSAQFRYTDGTVIALRAESNYHIEQHRYDSEHPEQNAQSSELLRGGLRAITGAIARERPEAVKTRTPVATIGIRGTVYEAFYIPPDGHPALPGVAPGHYTMVLRGRVVMTNPAGELLLGNGEIGYTPDANTAPVLRPDLAGLFGLFAALDEAFLPSTVVDDQQQTDASRTAENQSPQQQLAEQTLEQKQRLTPEPDPAGPLAYVVITQEDGGMLTGHFLTTPAEMEGAALLAADYGSDSGDLSAFSTTEQMALTTPSTHTAGDSHLSWGSYFDQSNGDTIDFITATNVLLTTLDLPTTGEYSYYYAGGTGFVFDADSRLVLSFDDATMDAILSANEGALVWSGENANISDFYGTGLILSGAGNGSIIGRFVGSEADATMGYYTLNDGTHTTTGTAAFDRHISFLEPEPEPEPEPTPEPTPEPDPTPEPSPGPFAYVTTGLHGSAEFMQTPVQTETNADGPYLASATEGVGHFAEFDAGTAPDVTNTGSTTLTGDTEIFWGTIWYPWLDGVNQEDVAHYIVANNVLQEIPTTGSASYVYLGGSGTQLGTSSSINADFNTATMDIQLEHDTTTWEATAPISEFYLQWGIELSPSATADIGNITGRFVGPGAEGIMSLFSLDGNTHKGTAAFGAIVP